MGLFDGSKKQKEAEITRLQQDLAKSQSYAQSLEQRIQQNRTQAAQTRTHAHINELSRLQAALQGLRDEKTTLQDNLNVSREGWNDASKTAEELSTAVAGRDEQITMLQGVLSRITGMELWASTGDAQAADLVEVVKAQSNKIQRLESMNKGQEKAIADCLRRLDVSDLYGADASALASRQLQDVNSKARKIKELETLVQNGATTLRLLTQQKDRVERDYEKMREEFEIQRETTSEEKTSLLERMSQAALKTKDLETTIFDIRRVLETEKKTRMECEEGLRSMMNKHHKEKKDWEESHTVYLRNSHDRLEEERESRREAERALEAKTAMVGQLQQQLQDSTTQLEAMTAELQQMTETNDQTRLTLNRARVELNNETRKARQAEQEKDTLGQQFGFVQQQCVVLQEKVTAAAREQVSSASQRRAWLGALPAEPPVGKSPQPLQLNHLTDLSRR
jgi:chromosome segregation ATPase